MKICVILQKSYYNISVGGWLYGLTFGDRLTKEFLVQQTLNKIMKIQLRNQ